MSVKTMGSLNVDAVGRKARLKEPGLLTAGVIRSVEHTVSPFGPDKGQPQTKVAFVLPGNYLVVTRPAFTEIELEDA